MGITDSKLLLGSFTKQHVRAPQRHSLTYLPTTMSTAQRKKDPSGAMVVWLYDDDDDDCIIESNKIELCVIGLLCFHRLPPPPPPSQY